VGGSVTHPLRRVPTPQPGRAAPAQRGPSVAAPILQLHRLAGNRAVTGLVLQRKVGWTDASKKAAKDPTGKATSWNADEHPVGKVRRIPLEGLKQGTGANLTPKQQKGWHDIPELTSEGAIGKAIVLVPEGLNAKDSIEVVVFLHGHTEGTHRPFGGFRTLDQVVPKASKHMQDLRRGIDPTDIAPVRDVALDQSAQQLEESREKQLVIVLPQGGLTSQFSKAGGKDFDARPYVDEIVTRLQTEKKWKDDTGGVAAAAPSVTRIVMAGHSGASAALSHMADAGKPGAKPGDSSVIPDDLVIYDAINGSDQRKSFENWATRRLEQDFAILTDDTIDDKDKLVHLNTAPKLLGYTTDSYIGPYILLDRAIEAWFAAHMTKLGKWAPCLRANYRLDYLDVDHEELMRGSGAAGPRAAGTGTILDAIRALHTKITSVDTCPPWPKPLEDRYYAVHPDRKPKPKPKQKAKS
jgi:hypothetical protein